MNPRKNLTQGPSRSKLGSLHSQNSGTDVQLYVEETPSLALLVALQGSFSGSRLAVLLDARGL